MSAPSTLNPQPAFYIAGGTVPRDAPSYIVRKADEELLDGLRKGQFCYVLTSRQMGKSSLMVRTATQLRQERVAVAALDLTAIGINVTVEQWYEGLLNLLARALDLDDEMEEYWLEHRGLSPLQRWLDGLRDLVLTHVPGRLVIFVDEIDVVRALPFSADEFFAGIRECYNRRAEDPQMERLTFCLLGVATPGDLIRDTRNTPFNIGRRIELTDFTPTEAGPLKEGLQVFRCSGVSDSGPEHLKTRTPEDLLRRILHWTGGQPYLTQRLCKAVAESAVHPSSVIPHPSVDSLCAELFLGQGARERDDNLLFVRDRLLKGDADPAALLDLYRQVLEGKRLTADETNPLVSQLLLCGIVRPEQGRLAVRNRIYRHVFDRAWVREHMPDAEQKRQRAAYRRGLLRAATLAAALVLLLCTAAALAIWGAQAREESRAAHRLARERQATLVATQRERDRANQAAEQEQAARLREREQRKRAEAAKRQAEIARQQADWQRQAALSERQIALQKSQEADSQRRRALAAERIVEAQSLLERARSLRYRGALGQRFESLDALARAAKLATTPALRMELRNEAVACLSLPADLRPLPALQSLRPASGEGCLAPDPGLRLRLVTDKRGNVVLSRISDGKVMKRLPGPGQSADIVTRWSDDGRYAVIAYIDGAQTIWDLHGPRRIYSRKAASGFIGDILPNGRLACMLDARNRVHVLELPSGRDLKQLPGPHLCTAVRFSPDGLRIAFSSEAFAGVRLVEVTTGKVSSLPGPVTIHDIAWHPGAEWLAGAGYDGSIYLWNARTGKLDRFLTGHGLDAVAVEFNHRGDLLASAGWDRKVRLWDPLTGKLELAARVAAETLRFSPDDKDLVVASGQGASAYALPSDPVLSRLPPSPGPAETIWAVDFSPDGRWLAAAADDGVHIVDARRFTRVTLLSTGAIHSVHFSPDGTALYAGGDQGVRRWSVRRTDQSHDSRLTTHDSIPSEALSIGPSIVLRPPDGDSYLNAAMTRDGSVYAVAHADSVDLVGATSGDCKTLAGERGNRGSVSISPDGRYLAAGAWIRRGVPVSVWDLHTGKQILDLPLRGRAYTEFTADGRWLMTGEESQVRFWSTANWRSGPTLPREESWTWCPVAVSRDRRTLALITATTRVQLFDIARWQPLALLDAPAEVPLGLIRFSPDGATLVAGSGSTLWRWDLHLLRRQLADMGLDWDLPAPPAPAPLAQLSVRFEPGERLSAGAARDMAAMLERHLSANPNDHNAANELAWLYVTGPQSLRNPLTALPLARLAVQRVPTSGKYWNTLGVVLYRLGRWKEACDALRRSLRLGSDSTGAFNLYPLAVCCRQLGQEQEARDLVASAARWQTSHPLTGRAITDLADLRAEAEAALSPETHPAN